MSEPPLCGELDPLCPQHVTARSQRVGAAPQAPRVVHILRGGAALCRFDDRVPREWPEGHAWTGEDELGAATCSFCQLVHSMPARCALPPFWRVGRTLGRTLYRDGVCVGIVDTPEIALAIVDAMNAARAQKYAHDVANAEDAQR